jgi:glutamate-1-semialdehyde 2,1-aminomutase
MEFTRSREVGARLGALVPGAAHTYAKGPDQYPELSPSVLVRGDGSHVWDADGNEFIEYGMGLRSVGLGHAYAPVVKAVQASLTLGTNFTRPAGIELECAERFCGLITNAEMVKFTKDGSTATSAAVKLARRATGRDLVAICADHPFFSYDDWFIVTSSLDGGIPDAEAERTVPFRFNDLGSVRELFATHPGQVAAVILEPARIEPPAPGFLESVRDMCIAEGALLIFDEMITGFRYALRGAQDLYGVQPDLSTFGKALANGFALSALCGKSEYMRLGSRERADDDVFLLSTTHGAEIPAMAATIATIDVYEREPVIPHLYEQGGRLSSGLADLAAQHGISEFVGPIGFPCNLLYRTLDPDGQASQPYRTLFLQETIRRGVLMPSLVVSYSHSDEDVDRTLEAIDGALGVYANALTDGCEPFLVGKASRPVFERKWRVASR